MNKYCLLLSLMFFSGTTLLAQSGYEMVIEKTDGSKNVFKTSKIKKTYFQKASEDVDDARHINICVLGNSYAADSYSYVPFILLEYGITCKIQLYYRGSGSLKDLDEQWTDDTPYSIASLDGKQHVRLHYCIDTRKDSQWRNERVASAAEIVSMDKWDIISLQQVSTHCQYLETYEPYLQNVIDKINVKCSYPFSLAWFMAYNRASDNANEENLAAQKEICSKYPFGIVFPVATTIFNCQSNNILAALGDSEYKKMYASDNIHLQEGLPCYAASLAIVQSLLQYCFHKGSVMDNKIRPTQSWINSINGINPNGQSTGVTEENCSLVQQAAMNAYYNKFSITPWN